jgi:hypothetical protein
MEARFRWWLFSRVLAPLCRTPRGRLILRWVYRLCFLLSCLFVWGVIATVAVCSALLACIAIGIEERYASHAVVAGLIFATSFTINWARQVYRKYSHLMGF